MPESTCAAVSYRDEARVYFSEHNPGPVVQVRFEDGVLVEIRPATRTYPQSARVVFDGLPVRKIPLNVDAQVHPDGRVWQMWASRTGVAGVDGAYDLPAAVREAAEALCRRRAREARDTIRAAIRPAR